MMMKTILSSLAILMAVVAHAELSSVELSEAKKALNGSDCLDSLGTTALTLISKADLSESLKQTILENTADYKAWTIQINKNLNSKDSERAILKSNAPIYAAIDRSLREHRKDKITVNYVYQTPSLGQFDFYPGKVAEKCIRPQLNPNASIEQQKILAKNALDQITTFEASVK